MAKKSNTSAASSSKMPKLTGACFLIAALFARLFPNLLVNIAATASLCFVTYSMTMNAKSLYSLVLNCLPALVVAGFTNGKCFVYTALCHICLIAYHLSDSIVDLLDSL